MATYTVVKGDTIQSLAKKYGVSASQIAKSNNLKTTSKLKTGNSISIPTTTKTYYNRTNNLTSLENNTPGSYKEGTSVKVAESNLNNLLNSKPGDYQKSKDVLAAQEYLNNLLNSKPGDYQKSPEVLAAEKLLAEYQANKPGEYQSQYSNQISELLNKIQNREDFTYDFNADPLYQQYKDQYKQQGQMAMMNTVGQAAQMTGGYGNSYGVTAGQQAYQQNLQNLNSVIPDLYGMAMQKYQMDGDKMYDEMGLLQGLDASDYEKYRDTVSDYWTGLDFEYSKFKDLYDMDYQQYRDLVSNYYNDLTFANDRYQNEYNMDYNQYSDKMGWYYQDVDNAKDLYKYEKDFDYGSYRDQVSDWTTDRNYYYNKKQDEIEQQNWMKEYGLKQQEYSLAVDRLAFDKQNAAAELAYKYAALNASRAASTPTYTSPYSKSSNNSKASTVSPYTKINTAINYNNGGKASVNKSIDDAFSSGQISFSQAAALKKKNSNRNASLLGYTDWAKLR